MSFCRVSQASLQHNVTRFVLFHRVSDEVSRELKLALASLTAGCVGRNGGNSPLWVHQTVPFGLFLVPDHSLRTARKASTSPVIPARLP